MGKEYKIIRDNVHGYIRIPVDIVKLFIDTQIFQRLRYVEQTGMRTLYPSARHDRFIHSLGTYHLGNKAFTNFRLNVKEYSLRQLIENRKHYNVIEDSIVNETFWERCGVLFEIACLLHDCGHAPFSHTLEFIYNFPSSIKKLSDKILQYISSKDFETDFTMQKSGTPHELMSALVVCAEFSNNIENLLNKRNLNLNQDTDTEEFLVRMIIGCKYSKDNKKNRIKNCLISLLNSSSIDVDSLDYIVRDAKLSGIDNMSVDVDRLLNSLTIIEKTKFEETWLNNAEINTNVINGILKKKDNTKAKIIGKYQGVARIEEYKGIINGLVSLSGQSRILNNSEFEKNNNNIIKIGTANYSSKISNTDNMVEIELFGKTKEEIELEGSSIKFRKDHCGNLNLEFDNIEIDSAFIEGKLSGCFSGDFLGFYENLGGTLVCELGFDKSSLSVIQNVLIARNYEYQWIYTHHKVVYYSNYLIIELFKLCIKFLLDKQSVIKEDFEEVWSNILSWKSFINENGKYQTYDFAGIEFFRPTDSDILGLYKKCFLICMKDQDKSSKIYRLLNEFFTRVYRKSLWKSYAEYGIFFDHISDDEKGKLFRLIMKNSVEYIMDQYGYFNSEWEKQFNDCGMQNVLWVNADSKLKALNPDNTCILFRDGITLNYRTVSASKDLQTEQKLNLFYIYYDEIDGKKIKIDKLKDFIYSKLRSF